MNKELAFDITCALNSLIAYNKDNANSYLEGAEDRIIEVYKEKHPSIFLFAEYWRGAMNVSSMRLFSTMDDLVTYVKTLKSILPIHRTQHIRVYEYQIGKDEEPKLRTKELLERMDKPNG